MAPYTFSRFSNRVTSKFKVSAKIASSPPSLAWPIWSFLGLPLSICLSGVSLNALNPWFSSPADPPHPPPARSTRRARELVSLPLSVVLLERVSSHLLLYPRVLSRTQPFSGPPHTGLLSLACGATAVSILVCQAGAHYSHQMLGTANCPGYVRVGSEGQMTLPGPCALRRVPYS